MLDARASASTASIIERSGDLVAIAEPDAWFTYYYWLDDARAPDFARTVEIHRKPGYDPVELFLDPAIRDPGADRRLEARPPQARFPHAARRHPARRHARQRLARPPRRCDDIDAPVCISRPKRSHESTRLTSTDVYGVFWIICGG